MTQTEALKLALEALEYRGTDSWRKRQPAITAIKAALEVKDETAQQRMNKLPFNDSFERDEAARNIVREFMRNH
jgi:hypothetical protein